VDAPLCFRFSFHGDFGSTFDSDRDKFHGDYRNAFLDGTIASALPEFGGRSAAVGLRLHCWRNDW